MADILFSQIAGEIVKTGTDILQTSGRDAIGAGPGRYVCDAQANAALLAAHPRFVAKSANNRYFRALPEAGRVAVELGGARGDDITDDGPAIRAAAAYAAAIGARGIALGAARYRMERIPASEMTVAGNPPALILPSSGGIIDGAGAELSRQGGGRGFVYDPAYSGGTIALPLAADPVAGSPTVTLAPGGGAQLAVGALVLWRIGEFAYDTPETPNWDFARVVSIAGEVVTLDKPMPEAVNLASVTGANKALFKLNVLRDLALSDIVLGGSGAEDGVALYGAQRVTLRRIGGRNIGSGLIVAQYCDGLTANDCWLEGSLTSQPSFGTAFSFAECRNVVLVRPRARGAMGLIKAEAGAEVSVIGGHFENTIVDAAGNSPGVGVMVCSAVGRASVALHDLTVTGFGGYRLAEANNGVAGDSGAVCFTGITRLRHPTAPFSIPLESMTATLDLTIGGAREVYNFARLRTWRRRFVLRDGEYLYAVGPRGLLAKLRGYASPGLTIGASGQLTGMWVGRQGDNGTNIATSDGTGLVPGRDVAIPCYAGLVAGAQWTLRGEALSLLCVTAPGAGLEAANEFVELQCWMAELEGAGGEVTEAAWRSENDARDPFEALFASYDLPAVPAGGEIVLDLAVPDMTEDALIEAVRVRGGLAGLVLRSAEPLSGLARLTFANPTAAAIDRTSADLTIGFVRPLVGT